MLNPGIFNSWSIRKKLLLLNLVVLLPASVIIVVMGIDKRRDEIAHAQRDALLLVRSLAARQEQIAVGTKQMLCTLSRLPEVMKLDAQACHELFRDLLNQYPFYSTIGLATPDGNLFADAMSFTPGTVNIAEQKHIRDVINTIDFSAGEFIIGKITRVQSIHYSYPVLDADDNLIAIVIAGFNLSDYASLLNKAELPEGSAVEVLDHRGVRIYRLPEHEEAATGKPISDDVFKRMSDDLGEGLFERNCKDGVSRIYAFKQLRLGKNEIPYLYLRVGIAKDRILYRANLVMLKNLTILGLAALVTISFSWFLGNIAFIRPINQLVSAARRLGSGESSARTGLLHASEEMGQLAKSFDEMASLLEAKETERKQALRTLAESEERYRAIVHDQTELIARFSPAGMVTFVNEANRRCFGMTQDELVGRTFWHVVPEEEHDRLRAHIGSLSAEQPTGTIVHRVIAAGGEIRWLQWVNRAIFDEQSQIVEYQGVGRDVTDLKMARQKLSETTQRLQLAVASGNMGIWEWNFQSDELSWDEGMLKLYGFTEGSLTTPIGLEAWKATLHPDDLASSIDVLQAALDGDKEYVTEFRIVHPDGETKVLESHGLVIRDEKGKPVRMIGLTSDITQRKQAEEALKESEREKDAILSGLKDVVVEYVDPIGRIIWVNAATEKVTGMSLREMKGKRCFEVIQGLKEPCQGCTVLEAAAAGEFQEGEVRDSDGGTWIVSNNPIKDDNGRVSGVVHIAINITKRKLAEEALRASEEKYRMLFEHSPLGILHFDNNGIVTSCNENLTKITGSPKERIIGFNISTSLQDEGAKSAFSACMSGEKGHYEGYYHFVTSTDAKHLKFDYAPVLSQDGSLSGGMAIIEDISERRRAEEALKESEEQLRFLSSRLLTAQEEERKRLASEIHDGLGSTLSAIMIGLEISRKEMEAKGCTAGSLDKPTSWTQHAIDEARRLIMDLRPSILDDFGLLATLGWLARRQRTIHPSTTIEEKFDIEEKDIPESLKVVIFRIVQEALHNVAKYSQAKLVKLSLAKGRGAIQLTIEDDGVGFDVYESLHLQDERRGLGITSMKERAELSLGTFSISSDLGEGTIIHASWPLDS